MVTTKFTDKVKLITFNSFFCLVTLISESPRLSTCSVILKEAPFLAYTLGDDASKVKPCMFSSFAYSAKRPGTGLLARIV